VVGTTGALTSVSGRQRVGLRATVGRVGARHVRRADHIACDLRADITKVVPAGTSSRARPLASTSPRDRSLCSACCAGHGEENCDACAVASRRWKTTQTMNCVARCVRLLSAEAVIEIGLRISLAIRRLDVHPISDRSLANVGSAASWQAHRISPLAVFNSRAKRGLWSG
jgi:hypothetical protein